MHGHQPKLSGAHQTHQLQLQGQLDDGPLQQSMSQPRAVANASWHEGKVQNILKHAQTEAQELVHPINIIKHHVMS